MKKSEFYYALPEELIAQFPLKNRTDSRLLVYHRSDDAIEHRQFHQLIDYLNPGDLLVMNNTRVMRARLFGQKETGGQVEFLIERLIGDTQFLSHIKASKAPKPNSMILLEKGWAIRVLEKQDDLYSCEVQHATQNLDTMTLISELGHLPLPLYIDREASEEDELRYQTVYAEHQGSVAAPTAGLHFDEQLLTALKHKGIETAHLTLHIGAGTFRPVRTEDIAEHKMHAEWFSVSEALCEKIKQTKAAGHRVIAVGTTTLRSLESAALSGEIQPYEGETDIFIYPGFQFRVCDGLVTNFHLPESTLLMLVSAFIGLDAARKVYQTAVESRYRFYSYGDSSLLL